MLTTGEESHAGKPTYPIFASECVDRLVQDVLLPLLVGKRHTCLLNQTQPLSIQFVKEPLPELEKLYAVETAPMAEASFG